MGFLRTTADASAKPVELGEAEALGVLDDHDGGVGDVDANFDDGGGDEDLRFVFAEALHDCFFLVAGAAAVQEAELELGKNFAREALVFVDGGFELELRFFDDGIDDVGLMSGVDFAAERFANAGETLLGGPAGGDGGAGGGGPGGHGDVEVAIHRGPGRARDARGWGARRSRRGSVWRGFEGGEGFGDGAVARGEASDGGGCCEVGGDFGQGPFLGGGGVEGEDALERLADSVLAKAAGDGGFLASGFAVESEAEL